MKVVRGLTVLALGLGAIAGTASAQNFRGRAFANANGGGGVALPYDILQSAGAQWNVFPGGWFQNQGNMPTFGQAAMLSIGGQQVAQGGASKLDEKTGELILDGLGSNGWSISRHILGNKDEGYVRYIDVIKNTQAAPQTLALQLQSNLNFGVQNAQTVPDPKKKDRQIAWVAQTGAGSAAIEIYNGTKAKSPLAINSPPGSNVVQATLSIAVPAGHEVAVMHIHSTAASQDAANAFVAKFNEKLLIKNIPQPLRKLIVNFVTSQDLLSDMELLRGDLLDVVELRTGDQCRGTLKETSFELQTTYGMVSVPVDKVVSLFSSGQFRPRQLVVTADGQVIGGTLKKQTLDLQLSSGQITQIPLSQVARLGYRKRPGEPDEWNFDGKSLVMMRSGDRVSTQLSTAPVSFVTRFGKVTLKPEQIDQIILQQEEQASHQVILTDGSRFSGFLDADSFDLKLESDQPAKFPVSGISRLQFAGKVADVDDFTPTIKLGDDQLVGAAVGQIKLDTAFDTITVNATEIRSLSHVGKGPADVKLTLWDGTTLSGGVEDATLSCMLVSGVAVQLPIGLIDEYSQPQPQPAEATLAKIKAIIADLNNDHWKQRDHAQAELMALGPVAITTLRQLRAGQPLEAQKNIDLVLKDLQKQWEQQPAGGKPGASSGAAPADDVAPDQ